MVTQKPKRISLLYISDTTNMSCNFSEIEMTLKVHKVTLYTNFWDWVVIFIDEHQRYTKINTCKKYQF